LKYTERFRADVEQCMKCGFCAYFCPVYKVEKSEKALARGKDQLVKSALKEEQPLSRGFFDALDNCLLCKTCVQFCPAKTRIDHVVTAARADYVSQKGLPLFKSLFFRLVLTRRGLFGLILRIASWFQHVLPSSRFGRFRHLPHFLSALGAGRLIPEVAPHFLRRMLPERNPARGPFTHRIAFFSGCAAEYVFPESAMKMVGLLQDLGCDVIFDTRQGCCGAPAYFSGDFQTGRKTSMRNIEALEDYEYVVTGCATCGSGLKDYPVYLAENPEEKERFEAFASKVKDFSEFVVDVLSSDRDRFELRPEFRGMRITWHDPCHLVRHQEIQRQPREILKALDGLEFVEMPEADRCCGLGGSYSITHYDNSRKIADKKAANALSVGPQAVVTACPGCIIQIRDALARAGSDIPVYHIAELVQVSKGSGRGFPPR
jgi:glycolate oxidase iron-sulfur subunit